MLGHSLNFWRIFFPNFRLFSVTGRILKISTPDFIQTLHSDTSGPPVTNCQKLAISDEGILFEPPFWRNVKSKFKIWPPISPPPMGVRGQFWHHAMRDPQASLSSKTGHAGVLPEFLANFFPKFSVFFGLKCSEVEFASYHVSAILKLCTLTEGIAWFTMQESTWGISA